MGTDPVHETLRALARRLDELSIPYAVAGGMALVAHGYLRTTVDVDVVVTSAGLATIHQMLEGRGYVPPFTGSRNLRDTQTGVRIEFLISGQYPGDGRPKPVAFPEPTAGVVDISGIRFLSLPLLIQLKLASGMTSPGRLRDLADVQELIRVLGLRADFAAQLDPYVRGKYDELWTAVQGEATPQ